MHLTCGERFRPRRRRFTDVLPDSVRADVEKGLVLACPK
jgi:hypothetical protein